jgi:hypothetical protein
VTQVDSGRSTHSILEVVGPAGAGKTTIVRALLSEHRGLTGRPPVRRLGNVPLIAREGIAFLPWLFRCCMPGPRVPSPGHVKRMVYLQVLAEVLHAPVPAGVQALVFDQGPVFLLAGLRDVFEGAASPRLSRWWASGLHRWAALLDGVIWLDAPDAVLVRRINARDKGHSLRGRTTREASIALARARETYESVLADLAARRPGFTIVRQDTSGPLRETACAVASLLPLPRQDGVTGDTVTRPT